MSLSNISIRVKLIAGIILSVVLAVVTLAVIALNNSREALYEQTFNQLITVKESKGKQLEMFFNDRLADVEVLAETKLTHQALDAMFTAAEDLFAANASGSAVRNDPEYRAAHDEFFGFFNSYMESYGYYDVFLISASGEVVFTVTKEPDFATHLDRENTDLAQTWKHVMKSNDHYLSDTKPYAPSNGLPAQFIGAPIHDEGELVGVVALQISQEKINEIMQERAGMGETGESYVIGMDKRMRSDSFLDPSGHSVKASFAGTVAKNGVDTEAARDGISGSDAEAIIIDYNGNPVLSAYHRVDLLSGLQWVMLVEKDQAEVDIPVNALRNQILMLSLIIVLVFSFIGFLIALNIQKGITDIVKKVKSLGADISRGKLDSRMDVAAVGVDFRELSESTNTLIEAFVEPIETTADYVEKISAGNIPAKISKEYFGDFNKIKNNLNGLIDNLNTLIAEMNTMSEQHDLGDIDIKIDDTRFSGEYAAMAKGINAMVFGHIAVKKKAMACIKEFGNGNFDAELEQFPGKKAFINDTIELVRANLKSISSEITTLINASKAGQLDKRANAKGFDGNWLEIAEGINSMLQAIVEPIQEAASVMSKMADKDMTSRVTGNYRGQFDEFKTDINKAVENLDMALSQVAEGVNQVNSASDQISRGSQSLAEGANEQASSLEEVSSSLEEMSSMTNQNADNARQANALATEATDFAQQGNSSMLKMTEAINKIKDSSDETAKIIKTIDEIAFQTNLLALNAAVEAARAGDAGKGFAVVAEEVRNLAMRSAEAAKNTAEMIESSVANAENGVKITDEVAQLLLKIDGSSKKVNTLVAEIASASKEQASGIEQVNTAVAQMNQVTQQNAANSEESASAAEELNSQAAELSSMVGNFMLSARSERPAPTLRPAAAKSRPTAAVSKPKAPAALKGEAAKVIPLEDDEFDDF